MNFFLDSVADLVSDVLPTRHFMFSVFYLAFRKYWECRHLWNRLKRNQLCDGRYDEFHFSPGEGGLLIRHLQVRIVRELDPLVVLVHVVKFERIATLPSFFQHA